MARARGVRDARRHGAVHSPRIARIRVGGLDVSQSCGGVPRRRGQRAGSGPESPGTGRCGHCGAAGIDRHHDTCGGNPRGMDSNEVSKLSEYCINHDFMVTHSRQ